MTERADTFEPRTVAPVDRRRFVKTTGATVTGLGIAGCQGLAPDDDGNGDGDANDVSDTSDLGVDTIGIGVLAPGPEDHMFGRAILNSARLAAQEINDAGGVLGADIELAWRDTEFSPHTAREGHRELILEENVDMTIGPMFTASLGQVMQSVAEQETLNFAAGSAGKDIPLVIGEHYDRFKYVFRPTAVHLGRAVPSHIEFIKTVGPELGWERIALIDESQVVLDEFHEPAKNELPEVFEMPIVERVSGVTNWTPLFDEVEEADADILLSHVLFMGQTMIEQWSSQQRNFELGGLNLFGTMPDFYESLDGAPRYTWTGDYLVPGSGNTDRTDWYFESLQEQFGEGATYAGPLAYDNVKIYAKAVSETGTMDEDELIEYLENDLVYTDSPMLPRVEIHGPDGEFPHDPVYTDQEEMRTPIHAQWQQSPEQDGTGQQVVIYPEDQAFGDYVKPPWVD